MGGIEVDGRRLMHLEGEFVLDKSETLHAASSEHQLGGRPRVVLAGVMDRLGLVEGSNP